MKSTFKKIKIYGKYKLDILQKYIDREILGCSNKRNGKGSFGQVFKGWDHKRKEFVALKILRNKKRLYKQGLIEAGILETLRDGDPDDKKNIVRI